MNATTSQIEALKTDLDESNLVIEKQRRTIQRQLQATANLEVALRDQSASANRERIQLQTEFNR
jgi:hypothetical protein